MWFNVTTMDICLIFAFLISCAIIFASSVRLWVKLTHVKFNSNVNLRGKTILITGANSGIGKETARYMAKRGARVIMACRTIETAKQVRDEIASESENSKIILHYLDLSSFQSIRDFCSTIIETEAKIDVLIHNAGYGGVLKKAISVDGLEYTWAANHYGPFLMTVLLMDLLRKSAPCRIVVVGSKAHVLSTKFDPTIESHLNPVHAIPFWNYRDTKLANLLFTFELARRLEGTGITVNCLHPGAIDTGIWRNYPFPLNIITIVTRVFLRTLEEGIQTTLHVALSTGLENVTGQYFRDCQPGKTSQKAHNIEWQKVMWDESVRITRITENDPIV